MALAAVGALMAGCGAGGDVGGDDQAGDDQAGDDPAPRYVPGHVPHDLPLAEVVELPEPVDAADRTSYLAIAWTDDPDPLPDADSRAFKLGVRHREMSAAPPRGERIDLGARVEVDGRWRWTEWTDDEDRTFSLSSVGLDEATFDAVRASVHATGTSPLDVQVAAPEPFREVVRFAWDGGLSGPDESGSGRGPFLVDPVGGGYVALFSGPELGSGPHASLAVGRTTPAAAWLSIVAQSPTPPVVGEVRGHRSYEHRLMPDSASSPEMEAALEADPEAAESWRQLLETVILQWWEDDVAITIVASPASEARRMAESLRAVDESDWEAFATSATGLPDLERPPTPGISVPPSAPVPMPSRDGVAPSTPAEQQHLGPSTTVR